MQVIKIPQFSLLNGIEIKEAQNNKLNTSPALQCVSTFLVCV